MGERQRILPYARAKPPRQLTRRGKIKRIVVGVVTASGFGVATVFGIWKVTHAGGSAGDAVGIAMSVFGVVLGILIAAGILHQP